MSLLFLAFALASAGAGAVAPEPDVRASALPSAVRAGIAVAVQDGIARHEIPGAVILVAVDGRVVYHEAFGDAQVEPSKVPMRRDTIFDLASLTKPLATGTALALLADQGVLTLRDRVSRWLPRFTGGGKEAVTILDLATHSGGLNDAGLYDPQRPMVTTAKVFDLLWTKELFVPPGTAYLYADYNYITLGKVVEAAVKMPLDRFFAERIAKPLGLTDTGFKPAKAKCARCAATERLGDRWLRGEVHDPRAHDMDGVAGHAGLFSTADEVRVIPQVLLDGGTWKGKRFLSPGAAAMLTHIQSPGGLRPRFVGWDTDPDGYGPRGDLFPFGGFGHTGFTGTSVWADPGSRTVIVILANRVHPAGGGNADPVRRRVANLVARSVMPARSAGSPVAPKLGAVLTGIDVLEADGFKALQGKRIGVVTNLSVLNAKGETTLSVLRRAPGVTIAALFTPEHGLEAKLDEKVPSGEDAVLKVPIHSLYGETFRPKPEWLKGLDALVVDLPDIGVRFYTYHATLGHCLEAAIAAGLEVIVLDRPNPITGLRVEGPRLPKERWGFTGYTSLTVRHGMTIGELGLLMNGEHAIGAKLTVIPVKGWRRGMWFDETGLPWANPSPNIRTLTQAILYPAVGLIEATNLSVGRGTDAPFEHLGAPWMDGARVARELNARQLPGIRFYPVTFTPVSGPCANEECPGVGLQLTDREAFRPVMTGLSIADVLRRVHGESFRIEGLDNLLGCPPARESLVALVSPDDIAAGWRDDEAAFEAVREKYLLY
ncbi:MAG: exo-beta-N-acetylmuramidase NamZ domain-containing protein [Candidatus Coatesbacteria bacterium]